MAYANRHNCPLTCMRAPECAASMLLKLVNRILSLALATLIVDPLILALNEADRDKVLQDFSCVCKHIRLPVFVIRSAVSVPLSFDCCCLRCFRLYHPKLLFDVRFEVAEVKINTEPNCLTSKNVFQTNHNTKLERHAFLKRELISNRTSNEPN